MGEHAVFADGTEQAAVAHFRQEGWVHVRRPGAEALAARTA